MPFKTRYHKQRLEGQRDNQFFGQGVGRVWPFPVAKIVIVVVVMRNLAKIAEATSEE